MKKKHGDFLGRAPRQRIPVTGRHIIIAVARNSNHCMIAEAVKDACPHLSHVAVDLATIRATDRKKKERYCWLTPRVAQVGLVKIELNKRKEIRPFVFELREGQVTVSGSDRLKKYRKPELRRSARGGTNVQERVGGSFPPKITGQRRAFGLRGLKL